jgi:hypothetical protein
MLDWRRKMPDMKGNKKRDFRLIIFSLTSLLFLASLIFWITYSSEAKIVKQNHSATEQTELLLTKEHGDEAKKAVEEFESLWMSQEMINDKLSYYNTLLTDPILNDYISRHEIEFEADSEELAIDANVIDLRVIEYSSQKMKVIACVQETYGEFDKEFNLLSKNDPFEKTMFYVFIYTDFSWKVANIMDISNHHQAFEEWIYSSQASKEISGEFDQFAYKDCHGKSQ